MVDINKATDALAKLQLKDNSDDQSEKKPLELPGMVIQEEKESEVREQEEKKQEVRVPGEIVPGEEEKDIGMGKMLALEPRPHNPLRGYPKFQPQKINMWLTNQKRIQRQPPDFVFTPYSVDTHIGNVGNTGNFLAGVLNFTNEFFAGDYQFFNLPNRGATLAERVMYCMTRHPRLPHLITTASSFIPPFNPQAYKKDLPNVTYLVCSWLLQHWPRNTQLLFVDPVDRIGQQSFNAIDLMAMSEEVRTELAPKILTNDIVFSDNGDRVIINLRGGWVTPAEYQNLKRQVAFGDYVDCQITPGKYNSANGRFEVGQKAFHESSAMLMNVLIQLPFRHRKPIKTIAFILDEFSGYAMTLAATMRGFGLEKRVELVAYRQGVYTVNNTVME